LTSGSPAAIVHIDVKIRIKIILIVLPLIITPLFFTAVVASLAARNGITRIATNFLQFKTEVLGNYIHGQWNLLTENDLAESEEFVEVAKSAVETFAANLVKNDTELIFAIDSEGRVVMQTDSVEPRADELTRLKTTIEDGWNQVQLEGIERVAQISTFAPFDWNIFVTEHREVFYRPITQIFYMTGAILIAAMVFSLILLLAFSSVLTRPLEQVVTAMRDIIATSDLSKKVTLTYKDETGRLGHYFNLMTGELDKAYNQIKSYALQAVIAQKKEKKIRQIFQKYVPKDVIDQFFANPEAMLVGENRVVSILFSDIRSFTTISESMKPDELVESLNRYFQIMVDVIMDRHGIVDKFIGDAIMAIFGAPASHSDDSVQSVLAGLEMSEALTDFNEWQRSKGRAEFRIGVGINYGVVTVGNIGSEKKMDYTVIGDMVNVASRMEGLTKLYHEPVIITESLKRKIQNTLPCRLLDRVVVKGKTRGNQIFSVRKSLSSAEEQGWKLHHHGLELFYGRKFDQALRAFTRVRELIPEDHASNLFLAKCTEYVKEPPPPDWTGDVYMRDK
jgi:adenylate cyclase